MRWPWSRARRQQRKRDTLGAILPQLTCQAINMRRELARLSREILAVNVALERVRAQLEEAKEVPLFTPDLEPTEFTPGRRQR
jgi:hypothetical protein